MSVHHCCKPLFQAMAASRKPRPHTLMSACMCSTSFTEHTAHVQRFQAAEQCHVKDKLHSLQQDVAKLKASNDRLNTQCKEKADREHMQNVSNMVLVVASLATLQYPQHIYFLVMKELDVMGAKLPVAVTCPVHAPCRSSSICATPKPLLLGCNMCRTTKQI